jgi:hypothetical protein
MLAMETADGIEGARLEVVPGCGHLSPLERPEAVGAALAGWLDQVAKSQPPDVCWPLPFAGMYRASDVLDLALGVA